jgi:hypothetical protein
MFKVTDMAGQDINLKDEVKFSLIQEDMFSAGEEVEMTGIVVSLNSETCIQVQPEVGASVEVEACHVEVISSLVNDVKKMATTDDMKAIILRAEARFNDEVANGTQRKKSGGSSTKKKKPVVTGTLEL